MASHNDSIAHRDFWLLTELGPKLVELDFLDRAVLQRRNQKPQIEFQGKVSHQKFLNDFFHLYGSHKLTARRDVVFSADGFDSIRVETVLAPSL